MQDSDEVEEQLRWALGKLPRWAVRVDAGGMWVAVSPTYELDGLVIHGRSAEELVHRVQVQVCVEALALDRAGRRPPGGVLCGVDFTGLVAEPVAAEPEADQFTIRTEGQLHMPGTVAIGPGRGGNPNGTRLRPVLLNDPGPPIMVADADPPKPPKPVIPQGRAFGFEGDPCPECGLMAMVRNGSCLKCTSCGATSGCS